MTSLANRIFLERLCMFFYCNTNVNYWQKFSRRQKDCQRHVKKLNECPRFGFLLRMYKKTMHLNSTMSGRKSNRVDGAMPLLKYLSTVKINCEMSLLHARTAVRCHVRNAKETISISYQLFYHSFLTICSEGTGKL